MASRRSCVLAIVSLVLFGTFAFFVKGWWEELFGLGEETIVTRVASPDGRRTAVVVETNGGATTSYGYSVRVEGEEAAMAYAATTASRYGVRVRWPNTNTLEIAFDHARWVRKGLVGGLHVIVKGEVEDP